MKETTNYSLQKPEGTDYVDIEVLNGNMDTVDAELGKAEEHRADGTVHVTAENKASWDAKETPEGARSKANEALAEALLADHSHPNKAELDGVTADKVASWDGAAAHVADGVRHLTAAERTSWNAKAAGEHTHTAAQVGAVPVDRKVNGKALTEDVTLTAADVGGAAEGHNHDARYYTEAEVDTKLAAKSGTGHTHTAAQVHARPDTWLPTASEVGAAASGHTHDDRYYTESEMDSKLAGKSNTGHTHTAADVGAVPTGRTVNGKALTANISLTTGDVGAAASGHNHDAAYAVKSTETAAANAASAAGAAQATANAALPKAGGTLTGNLVANGGTDYATARVRNIHGGTADLTAGLSVLASGAIYLVYE